MLPISHYDNITGISPGQYFPWFTRTARIVILPVVKTALIRFFTYAKGTDLPNYTELRDLGFKGGLETHQQLGTTGKLFCRCPARIRNDKHNQELLRHMRPTLSEFGEYDGTALMEFKTKKQVHYLLYNDSVCTYEMDDTPPFQTNPEAVNTALQLAMMFNMSLVDELHITRKQYLDGSIPTGFQRTAIVGVNGVIPFLGRDLHFIQMSLEEDACREVSDIGHHVVFRTDRLSIPLVEPVTAPELLTPLEMALAAKLVGETMRSTHLVRRGIGSVRQDVNVSIKGGTRIEIKGVPRISFIEPLSRIEAYRQKALLDLRHELRHSNLEPGLYKPSFKVLPTEDAADGKKTALMTLSGFRRYLNYPTQPGKTFLDELRGRVRVIACLEDQPFVEEADQALRMEMQLTDEDTAVLFTGPDADLITAAKEICIRIQEAFQGIPPETRQARIDGTTDFERILPGADRMYPDTDLPPQPIPPDTFTKLEKLLPMKPWERRVVYKRLGLSEHLMDRLLNLELCDLFDSLIKKVDMKPAPLASLLADYMRGSRRKGRDWMKTLGVDTIRESIVWLSGRGVTAKGSGYVLDYMCSMEKPSIEEAYQSVKPA